MKRITLLVFFLLIYRIVYSFDGKIETGVVYYPRKNIVESRLRKNIIAVRSEFSFNKKDLTARLKFHLSGRIDCLISNREKDKNALSVKIDDTYLDFHLSRPKIDIRMGYTKLFWGKLDQLSPVDIINPLDISRVFLDMERKDAKLPVPLFMISPYFGEEERLDIVLVPFFKKAIYDELNEDSSPFNIAKFPLPVEEKLTSREMEYGLRFSDVLQGIDYSLYYFRGFEDFPSYRLNIITFDKIEADYLKTDMFGCDFEMVKGRWGIRGEGALFLNRGFQKKNLLDYTRGNSLVTGVGIDRSFGNNYLNLSVLYKKTFVKEEIEGEKDEITFTALIKMENYYKTRALKIYPIYNIKSNSIFLGVTLNISPLDNLWFDLSTGIFDGREKDYLSKLKDIDFLSLKCRYNF